MSTPLDGLLVADFSRVLAGPLATMTLADLGADVIKVERPGAGDDTRSWGPPWTARSSAYFESVNRSKRSIALDFSRPDDLEQARELARRADVLVENFRSGSLARYGLDYDSVRRTNEGIVYCSISGFGSGAGADIPGYDFIVQAMGGLMSITGDADGDPRKVGVALVDVLTGKDAVIGILAALQARQQTGVGQHVEVTLLSSLLSGLVNQAAATLATGIAPQRMGNQHPSIAPYETLRCADGLLAIACGNDQQFRVLTNAFGYPTLADDPRFATNPDRVAHREELIAVLEQRTTTAAAAHWERLLRTVGVPVSVVGSIADGLARADELGLQPVIPMENGYLPQIRHPIRYSDSALASPSPPPTVGEHSTQLCAWLTTPPRP